MLKDHTYLFYGFFNIIGKTDYRDIAASEASMKLVGMVVVGLQGVVIIILVLIMRLELPVSNIMKDITAGQALTFQNIGIYINLMRGVDISK